MTMTLEEIKKGMSDKVFSQIVDIFLRQSTILQMLTFDDCVSASGGGSTMKYKYLRKVLPATAEFRKIGALTLHQRLLSRSARLILLSWAEQFRWIEYSTE